MRFTENHTDQHIINLSIAVILEGKKKKQPTAISDTRSVNFGLKSFLKIRMNNLEITYSAKLGLYIYIYKLQDWLNNELFSVN